ncbi:DUF2986 domain-containing protein [Shewanella sp. TC10]|uniref:DUF2986 domain-containing protein n=1 Tax=Shewanella sp. TC10 TaxID=1419739 RepID=UPI00129D56E8|nr:DUF2986 domain-containing protein [Shewanella sp. TC10]
MNRRKKINQTLKGKAKKANAKKAGSNKPKYVSKAERALENQAVTSDANQNQPIETVVTGEQAD